MYYSINPNPQVRDFLTSNLNKESSIGLFNHLSKDLCVGWALHGYYQLLQQ